MTALAFAAAGMLAGLAQAGLLWRAATLRGGVFGFALRFTLVGAVLLGGSLTGALLPASAGWAGGFAAGVALVLRRAAR